MPTSSSPRAPPSPLHLPQHFRIPLLLNPSYTRSVLLSQIHPTMTINNNKYSPSLCVCTPISNICMYVCIYICIYTHQISQRRRKNIHTALPTTISQLLIPTSISHFLKFPATGHQSSTATKINISDQEWLLPSKGSCNVHLPSSPYIASNQSLNRPQISP